MKAKSQKISMKKMLELAKFKKQQIYRLDYYDWDSLFKLLDKLKAGIIDYQKMPFYSENRHGYYCDYYQLYLKNRTVIIADGMTFNKFEPLHYKLQEVVKRKAEKLLEQIGNKQLELTERLAISNEIESLVNLVL